MPWIRWAEAKLDAINASFATELGNSKSASSQTNSSLSNIASQIRRIRALSYVSSVEFPGFTRTVSSGTIGDQVFIVSPEYVLTPPASATEAMIMVNFGVRGSTARAFLKANSGLGRITISKPISGDNGFTEVLDHSMTSLMLRVRISTPIALQFGLLVGVTPVAQEFDFSSPKISAAYYSVGSEIL